MQAHNCTFPSRVKFYDFTRTVRSEMREPNSEIDIFCIGKSYFANVWGPQLGSGGGMLWRV